MREDLNPTKIKILFAGDFYSTEPETIELSNELGKLFNSCDLRCLNFEVPLPLGRLAIANKNILKQSVKSPIWCEDNDIDIVSLANNHMCDYGEEGLSATKKAFSKSIAIGAGSWEEAYKVEVITVNDLKIGFFAGSSCDLASLKDEWTDKNKVGCAWINNSNVNTLLQEAKIECDYLFVLVHAGVEFMNIPLPEWRDRYRQLIDAGADAVIGSHPHVPQGVEEYRGKPIFYSLGNFWFDKKADIKPLYWQNSILAVLELHNGKVDYKVIPIVRSKNILRLDDSDAIIKHHADLSSILKDDIRYLNEVNVEVIK